MERDSRTAHHSSGDESILRSKLRLYLEVAGLSQREFSAAARVPQAAISRFLGGGALNERNHDRVVAAISPVVTRKDQAGMVAHVRWACSNISVMRDTDLLPRPPEFDLISRTTIPVLAALGSVDPERHRYRSPRTFVAPKLTGGFRRVTQLDPTDTLLYSAAVHALAPVIEAARASTDEVFSFRFRGGDEALLWRDDIGWSDFVARGEELAQEGTNPFVLVADISDCYGQIAIPSVVEALEDTGVSASDARNVGVMLGAFAGRSGRGLPVGPHPSALLAEAVLDRVDRHLQRSGRPFIRYVDDIRVFCATERDAMAAWHDLAVLLYERLGLSLNDAKTRIVEATHFASAERDALYDDPEEIVVDPEEEERTLDPAPELRGYLDALHRLDRQDFLMALDPVEGSLRRTRRLLRRARSTSLDSVLVDRQVLVRLVPMMRALSMYLLKRRPQAATPSELIGNLLWLAEDSVWASNPFVRLWIAEVMTTRFPDEAGAELDAFLERARPDIGLAAASTLAVHRGDREWVRGHEGGWDAMSPWDRRAVLAAAKILTDGERERWAQRAEDDPLRDPLLFALAHAVRTGDPEEVT